MPNCEGDSQLRKEILFITFILTEGRGIRDAVFVRGTSVNNHRAAHDLAEPLGFGVCAGEELQYVATAVQRALRGRCHQEHGEVFEAPKHAAYVAKESLERERRSTPGIRDR